MKITIKHKETTIIVEEEVDIKYKSSIKYEENQIKNIISNCADEIIKINLNS